MSFRLLRQLIRSSCYFYVAFLLTACTEGDPTLLNQQLIVEFNDVQSISVDANNTVISTGDKLQLSVIGTNSQAGTIDLTQHVSWSVSDDNLARVNNNGLLESFTTDGTVTLTATLASYSDSIIITLSSAKLVSIDIKADTLTPDTLETSVCRPIALKAFGNYDDTTTRDITDKANWTSSTSLAKLDTSNGVSLSYYQSPSATVRAESDGINSSDTDIAINDDIDVNSMILSPASIELSVGETQSYQLLASFNNGVETDVNISSAAYYSTNDVALATFKNNDEVLSALLQGTVTVTASCGSEQATATVTMSGKALDRIEISLDQETQLITMQTNATLDLTATAYYSDDSSEDVTDKVSWSSSNSNVIEVNDTDNKGQVTSLTTTGLDFVNIDYLGESDDITVQVQ